MYQINNEKFGQFLAEVRKEKQMTQKDLADKLFVSDKTVSKWERGNSMPKDVRNNAGNKGAGGNERNNWRRNNIILVRPADRCCRV